ncbi:uncharacterized protein LOC133193583 [Saccostrea echinata]|uniref:uncharacterized protein LOC133193583 n=1 Tax=Saccostrea echinata TaxID=191078 RepID=UPI002A82FF8F|nr:uncharacterized protein LOC133193583 [Saccostrea echinata]
MLEKAQALKDLVDTMMSDFKIRCFMINRLQQQKDKMNRHLARMKDYEQQYEQLANRPVKFLLFLENNSVSKIMGTPKVTQHALLSLPDEIKMEDVIRQGKIQITEIGKRQITKECVLKMMSTPVLHKSVTMKCRRHVYHISYVTSDRIWISDNHTLIMTNTEGEDLHRREISSYIERFGQHTVNGTGELVFIDKNHNITKLSTENNTTSTVINIMGPRRPECVYCSPSSGDLLVGMYKIDSNTYELNRFSSTGQHKQTIAYSTTGQELYSKPLYITENRNGDIIVSDWYYGVVVTDERGKHRFTYTGPLSGSPLYPCGICSDALSHILVCDIKSNTVQMIDKDGHFLSLILTEQQGIYKPRALCYDYKSHLLWVGSYNDSSWKNSKLLVYRYINRQDLLAGICIW